MNHSRSLFLILLLMLACLFCGPASAQEIRGLSDEEMHSRRIYGPIRVLNAEDQPGVKEQVEEMAFVARRELLENSRIDWAGTAFIVWVNSEKEFEEATRFQPEFVSAAANAQKMTIWINASSWLKATPHERQQVMTHEMGHLLIGNMTKDRRLPLWAEEGLVQQLAGEWSVERGNALSLGIALDSIPYLSELEDEFPRTPKEQELAYLISYKAVGELMFDLGGPEARPDVVLLHLNNDRLRGELQERLWNSDYRDEINASLDKSLGSRLFNALMMFASSTFFWGIIMVLVVLAWFKKRIQRNRMDRAERQEVWADSLTDADIVDIYGEKEENQTEELTPWEEHLKEKEDQEGWRN